MLQSRERPTAHLVQHLAFFSGSKLVDPSLLVALLLVKGQFLPLLSVPTFLPRSVLSGALLAFFVLLDSIPLFPPPVAVTVRLFLFLFVAGATLSLLRRLRVKFNAEVLAPPVPLAALALTAQLRGLRLIVFIVIPVALLVHVICAFIVSGAHLHFGDLTQTSDFTRLFSLL